MSKGLIIAGAVVEVAGFVLTWVSALKTRRAEVPEGRWLLAPVVSSITLIGDQLRALSAGAWARVRDLLAIRHGHEVSGRLSGSGRLGTVDAHVIHRGDPPGVRLERLEGQIAELRGEVDEVRADLTQLVEREIQALEGQRKAALQVSLLWQELGVVVFLVGVGLTTAGALV